MFQLQEEDKQVVSPDPPKVTSPPIMQPLPSLSKSDKLKRIKERMRVLGWPSVQSK